MKAIKITTSNQLMLCSRYQISYDEFPIGYWLVTTFGDNGEETLFEGLLDQVIFYELFTVDETLENDFISITKK